MKIIFSGTGTSVGVPMIGCRCECCLSDDPRDKRLRTSVIIENTDGQILVIDAGPDFRMQMLTHHIDRLDALVMTHSHADHIAGIDDVRPFNFRQEKPIPVYGNPSTLDAIQTRFPYIWNPLQEGGGLPQLKLHYPQEESTDMSFTAAGFAIQPLPAMHGKLPVWGYRIGNFVYLTDVSDIPEETLTKMHGLDLLVLGAPMYYEHSTHIHIDKAVAISQSLSPPPKRTLLTHLSHRVIHENVKAYLPAGIEPAYDGMICEI